MPRATRKRRKTWKDHFDTHKFSLEVSRQLLSRLGLDYIGITEEELAVIIEPIIADIASNRSTKPTVDPIANKLSRAKTQLYKIIASSLIEKEELNPEQIEFIVSYAPELAGKMAPRLYRIARKHKLDHVIEALRHLWMQYGLNMPLQCPICGFNSLTPDLQCIVCGAQPEEKEVKEYNRVRQKLEAWARVEHPRLVREAIDTGYIYIDHDGIKPPSMGTSKTATRLYLSRSEKTMLAEILESRAARDNEARGPQDSPAPAPRDAS